MSSSVIKVADLSVAYKSYAKPVDFLKELIVGGQRHDTFWALRNVSFNIAEGERVGIVGPNGAGKSTLLQTISGAIAPTSGSIAVNGQISSLLSLVPAWNMEESGIQNIEFNLLMRGIDRRKVEHIKEDIIDFTDLGPYIYNPVKTYSSGMSARLSFAIATAIEPDILIIDEVLGTGDGYFAGRAAKRLQEMCQKGRALLFVSHATSAVRMMCERCIWIENGAVRLDGSTEFVLRRYEEDMLRHDEATTRAGNQRRLQRQVALATEEDLADTTMWRLRIRPEHGGRFADTHYIRDMQIERDGERFSVPLETVGADGGGAILDTQSCEWGRIAERAGVECRMLLSRASMRPGGHILIKHPTIPADEATPVTIEFAEISLLGTEALVLEMLDVASGQWTTIETLRDTVRDNGWTRWRANAVLPLPPGIDIEAVRERAALALRKPVEITSVAVLVDGERVTSMKELTPFSIAIDIEHHEVMPSVNVSINVIRSDGTYVFYQPSGLDNRNIEYHDGASRVVFRFDENPFGYGDYEVNVFVTDGFTWENCPPQDIFDRALSSAYFHIDLARPIAFGLVNTLAAAEIETFPKKSTQDGRAIPASSVVAALYEPLYLPPPFTKMIAINSDVEWTSWRAQIDLLRIFATRGLETAFSYWFFADPSATWRLFDTDGRPSEHFETAARLIKAGLLDTCHSYGGVVNGRGTPFGRVEIARALETFAGAGLAFDAYSNHGGTLDTQNIGGPWCPPPESGLDYLNYQKGDVVGSPSYHLDLTQRHRPRFYWLDVDATNAPILKIDTAPDNQTGILTTQLARDGTPMVRFRRSHLGFDPLPDLLGQQLRQFIEGKESGYQVLYTHLGFRRTPHDNPGPNCEPYLTNDGFAALDALAEAQRNGDVLVTTTQRLLGHAWLHTTRPWTMHRDGAELQISFPSDVAWGPVTAQLRWSDLDGFAVAAEGLNKVTLRLGAESRVAQLWTVNGRRYAGIPWEPIDMASVLEEITK